MICEPRFQPGDIGYSAGIDTYSETLPCPDCLGTKRWEIKTPGGSTMTAECMRCGQWSLRDIPSLKIMRARPVVEEVVVHSYEFKYDPEDKKFPVGCYTYRHRLGEYSYHSYEDGNDYQLYSTKEEAAEKAAIKAEAYNARYEGQKVEEIPDFFHLSTLSLPELATERHHSLLWDAWYSYNSLVEELHDLAHVNGDKDRGKVKLEEFQELLTDHEAFSKHYRKTYPTKLGAALKVIADALKEYGPDDPSEKLVEAFGILKMVPTEFEEEPTPF